MHIHVHDMDVDFCLAKTYINCYLYEVVIAVLELARGEANVLQNLPIISQCSMNPPIITTNASIIF